MKMSLNECRMVDAYIRAAERNAKCWGSLTSPAVGSGVPNPDTVSVERKSDREFDLSVSYTDVGGTVHRSWLPLGSISQMVNWSCEAVVRLTDYPDMVRDGDWSGVRDTDNEKLWAIFDRFCVKKQSTHRVFA